MAKVSDLKFEFGGNEMKVGVTVGVDGYFKCTLPKEIATALKLTPELRSTTLSGIQSSFYTALDRYKKAETTQVVYIAVKYGASGWYKDKANGTPLFDNSFASPYNLRNDLSSVGLEFKTVLLETVDGVEQWYLCTVAGGVIKKHQVFYSRAGWKMLDYSEVYLETLNKARENMRNLSEMLHKFIEQDKEQMQLTLSAGKLLLN